MDAFSFSLHKNASIDLSLCVHISVVSHLSDDITFADTHTHTHNSSQFFLFPISLSTVRSFLTHLFHSAPPILIMLFVLMLKVWHLQHVALTLKHKKQAICVKEQTVWSIYCAAKKKRSEKINNAQSERQTTLNQNNVCSACGDSKMRLCPVVCMCA